MTAVNGTPAPLKGVLDSEGQPVVACPRCPGEPVPVWRWDDHQEWHANHGETHEVTRESAPPPAHDLGAERAVLHAMLQADAAIDAAGDILLPDDFYRPSHQVIYHAMLLMRAGGEPVDPITVREYVDREFGEIQALGGHQAASGYLVSLWSTAENHGGSVQHHARTVLERATRRRAEEAISQAQQTLRGGDGSVLELLARAQDRLDWASRHAADDAGDNAGPVPVSRFITSDREKRRPWVVPGLLRAEDRALVTGPEGGGKTTLAYQFAACLVAGVHPFERVRIPAGRALIVDLENNRDDMQDTLAHLVRLGRGYPDWDDSNLIVWHHPQGIDLRSTEGAYRLASVIRKARPHLVCAGPLWKMGRPGKDGYEGMAWDVSQFWDGQRSRHGFALWMETHPLAGNGKKRDWRPRGGEIWQAWPEVGMALTPKPKGEPEGSLRVEWFRGQRGKGRCWPEMLHRHAYGNSWPWEGKYPDGTLMDRDPNDPGTNGGWS